MFDFKMKMDLGGIKKLEENTIKNCIKVVKKHAMNIQAVAAVNAPVDTGTLKGSIQARESDQTKLNWIIDDGVEYGVYVELGHGVGVSYGSGGAVTFAKGFKAAKHFLGGACEKEADKFFDDIAEAIKP